MKVCLLGLNCYAFNFIFIRVKNFEFEVRLFEPDSWLLGFESAHGFDEDGAEFQEFSVGLLLFTISLIFKVNV